MPEVTPNVGADPINPAYYAGTACAEIIEHMPTNVGFAAKYAWRLGEKDNEKQEAGKAVWYLRRELDRLLVAQPAVPIGYRDYATRRLRAAEESGKLDHHRGYIIEVLIVYTCTGDRRQLEQAISKFINHWRLYEDHKQQRD